MKIAKQVNKTGLTIIAFIGLVIMAFLTGSVWRYTIRRLTTGELQIEKDSLGLNLLYFFVAVILAYGIYKACAFLEQKALHIIALVLAVGLTAGIFYLIESASAIQIVSDQAQIIFGAEWLLDGKYEEIYNYSYFWVYPYQLLVSKFFSGIIQAFGKPVWESLKLLQYVNAVCVGITFYIGMCIAEKLFEDRRIEGLYLLFAVPFAPMYIYALFIYGEAIGVCSTVIAIYFYVLIKQKKRRRKWLLCLYWAGMAFCLWIAYLMRPGLLIVWIAILIMEILTCLREKGWRQVLYVIVILGVVLGGRRLYCHSIEEKTGLSLDKGAPILLWITMGMQGGEDIFENPGSYNGYNWVTFTEKQYDVVASIEQAKSDIYKRFAEWRMQPGSMLRFYKSKILNQWAEPSYDVFWSNSKMSDPAEWVIDYWYNEKHLIIYDFLNRFQSIAYLMILIYFFYLLLGKWDERKYFLGLILIGGFLFSIMWETKSRYVYPYIVIVLPCMAAGMKCCMEGIDLLIKKVRTKRMNGLV